MNKLEHSAVRLACACCGPTRRSLLAGGAAALASGIAGTSAWAQSSRRDGIIDVHHHISPPTFIKELVAQGAGERPTLGWTPERSIEDMDKAGVDVSITSITTPGVWFGDAERTKRLARECNDYGADLMRRYPNRFGLFATLPLPDIDASLKEIEYAFDVLKADGIGTMTSYGDKWLGDPKFAPVLQELNRRKAVLYTHPTTANCCRNLQPEVHYSVIELATDTTRTIASILFTGTAARFLDIKFIFSHAGGTMPFIAERFTAYPFLDKGLGLNLDIAGKVPGGVMAALQKFYYDTAQAAHPMAMLSLLKLVPASQVLFGTDFPFRTAADHVKGLATVGINDADMARIKRSNALSILPRLG